MSTPKIKTRWRSILIITLGDEAPRFAARRSTGFGFVSGFGFGSGSEWVVVRLLVGCWGDKSAPFQSAGTALALTIGVWGLTQTHYASWCDGGACAGLVVYGLGRGDEEVGSHCA